MSVPKRPAVDLLLKELNKWCDAFDRVEGNGTGEEATSLAVVVVLSVLRHMILTEVERRLVYATVERLAGDSTNERLAATLRRGSGKCSLEEALLELAT